MKQAIANNLGEYIYAEVNDNDVKRILKDPQEVERGAVYYGFWQLESILFKIGMQKQMNVMEKE